MGDARIVQLLERGLRHFALGELEYAAASWRQVLALEPENERACEYLGLVEPAAALGLAPSAAPAMPPEIPMGRGGAAVAMAPPPAPDEALGIHRAESLPWFAEKAAAGTEPDPSMALDDWFDRAGTLGGPPLPQVAAGTLPWQEWHSEAGLHGTGELPWDPDEILPVPAGAGQVVPQAAAPRTSWAVPPGFQPAAPVVAAAERQRSPAWSERTPSLIGLGDPWTEERNVRVDEEEGWTPWSPGPASTGWDIEGAGPQLHLAGGGSFGDALEMLDENSPAPVAVPAALEGIAPPGQDSRAEADTLMQGARELFDLGDFSGSLELVQKALTLQPEHADARDYLDRNQDTLVQMYESKLGSLESRPRVLLRPDEIVWLNLDHRAGFVLAQIDGTITIDDIYALSTLGRLDTAKILAELVEQGVIGA